MMQGRPFLKGELEMLLQARELQRVAKEQALRSSRLHSRIVWVDGICSAGCVWDAAS